MISSNSNRLSPRSPQPSDLAAGDIPQAQADAQAGRPVGGDAPVVLVVDDDQYIRQALVMLLSEEGVHCIAIGTGEAALNLLREGTVRPDVILLDVMMPGMDGWEFRQAQLADPKLAAIPVVMLTAASHTSRAAALGIRHLLRKPLDLELLYSTLQAVLPAWQLSD